MASRFVFASCAAKRRAPVKTGLSDGVVVEIVLGLTDEEPIVEKNADSLIEHRAIEASP